jgi:serine/alanine adding enzyme
VYHHLNMVLCGPEEQPQWNDYVQRSSHATVAHAFAWSAVIQQAYGHHSFYLMAKHDGIVKGIFPLILVKGWRAASLASMPFMDYGGICADDAVTVQGLLDSGLALMREQRCTSLEVRQVEPIIEVGATRSDKVTMLLDLTGGAERLWQSFPAKVRNQVRKAEKAGLTTMMGGAELLNEFYKVFVVNMRDLGSPVHSRQFFESMASEFGPRMRVILVREGHDTIGGGIALSFKETMLVPWASSLREHRSKCPNNLLYWEAFQFGCKQGCRTFDFGRSSVGSGTYEFKKQWGAQPVTLHWQVLNLDGGAGTTISSEDAIYRLAAEVWRRLPIVVTRVVGPRIRKYLTN